MDTALEASAFSEQQIDQYENDGVICLRGVIGIDWIARLRAATDRVIETRGRDMNLKNSTGNFRGDLDMWLRDPDFQAFAIAGPCAAIAKGLMRSSEIRLFSDQLFVKEPGTSTPSPWHHDQTYWPVLGDQVCSIWVPMDVVSRETSGLEYVQGSHRWGRRFTPQAFGERKFEHIQGNNDEPIPDFDAERDRYTFLSWDMEPGDCLVHHSLAIHGAGGNRSSTQRRRAVATRWLGDDTVFRAVSLFSTELTGLQTGEPVANSRKLFPPIPLPAGRTLPEDYWATIGR